MKKSICIVLSIFVLLGVLACCLTVVESGSFAYAASINEYKIDVDGRSVTLRSGALDDQGNMYVSYYGYFFGYSDIPVEVNVYSSPSFPIDFAIGATNLTSEQLSTRQKLEDLFANIVRFIDHVDDLSNVLFDGTGEFGNVTECFSDVYLYNHATSGTTLKIAPETYEMLQLAQEMYTATKGAFNPAVYRLVDLWGFSSRIYSYANYGLPYDREWTDNNSTYPLPEQKYIDAFSDPKFTDFSKNAVILEENNGEYYVTKNVAATVVDGVQYEQWIDLGGIAKGYVVDVARSMIKELGIDRFDVDAGSSSIAFGLSASGGSTRLGISDVFYKWAFISPRSALKVRVGETSVSTSGQNVRKYTVDGVEYAHIIDGAKGAPAQTGVRSVTVVVPEKSGKFWATKGDCLTTALTVMGYDGIVELANGYLKDNNIDIVVQYEALNGDRKIISSFDPNDVSDLSSDYKDFKWDDDGFYVANGRLNSRLGNYDWVLIVLGVILGVGMIALIVYHFVRGKNRTARNVQNARKDKAFKLLDVFVYMLVVLLIAVLFYVFVLDVDESTVQVVNVIDDETGETLFTYNVSMNDYLVKDDNVNGWSIDVEENDDGLTVTFTRDFNGETRFNVLKITIGQTPSVDMIDSICGFHQDCVRNFDAITHSGGAIVCSPNRLKIVTE